MSWADLDKLAVAKRSSGTVLVARDDRSTSTITDTKHLTILVAIARVTRARRAIAEKFAGDGAVIYSTTTDPPEFLVDAVTAAGGAVFDGGREVVARSPLATTVQLDAAFCDLASVVRRRLGAKTFAAALDVLESELRRSRPAATDPSAWWTAIIELVALTGELVREKRAARWTVDPTQRLPFALDLGKDQMLVPGSLAQTIVEGGAVSMRSLLEIAAPASSAVGATTTMAVLCHRSAVPIDKLTWELLLSPEVDAPDVPVIVYVEDRGGTIGWPFGPTTPAPERRARALANLAKEPFEIDGDHQVAIVTGGFYGAESLLVPAVMERVRRQLGGPHLMLVAVPERGVLVAIDGERATVDDDIQTGFLLLVERRYYAATERDRISAEVLVYTDKATGRVQSNLMEARRSLRNIGVDPDAE